MITLGDKSSHFWLDCKRKCFCHILICLKHRVLITDGLYRFIIVGLSLVFYLISVTLKYKKKKNNTITQPQCPLLPTVCFKSVKPWASAASLFSSITKSVPMNSAELPGKVIEAWSAPQICNQYKPLPCLSAYYSVTVSKKLGGAMLLLPQGAVAVTLSSKLEWRWQNTHTHTRTLVSLSLWGPSSFI